MLICSVSLSARVMVQFGSRFKIRASFSVSISLRARFRLRDRVRHWAIVSLVLF